MKLPVQRTSFVIWLADYFFLCSSLLRWHNCGYLSCHKISNILLECHPGYFFWKWLLHTNYVSYLRKHHFLSPGLKDSFQVLIIIPCIKYSLPCFLWQDLIYNTYDYFTSAAIHRYLNKVTWRSKTPILEKLMYHCFRICVLAYYFKTLMARQNPSLHSTFTHINYQKILPSLMVTVVTKITS